MKVHGIECPHCLQRVWSRHRHDMRYCFCEYCFVDGGREYTRSGWGGPDWETPWKIPKSVTIYVKDTK